MNQFEVCYRGNTIADILQYKYQQEHPFACACVMLENGVTVKTTTDTIRQFVKGAKKNGIEGNRDFREET